MSGLGRSPRWIAVAALVVCFASTSFGQSARGSKTSANWAGIASYSSAIPSTFTLQPATFLLAEPLKYTSEDHRKKKKGGGTTVPEGGSSYVYLGLAGFVCLSAILFSRRRSKLAVRPTAS